jgi:dihydrofolate synthase/folylpolyglutamate synthase
MMPDRPPTLEPMRRALELLCGAAGSLDPEKITLVAGTNGKGSVSATLEALLRSAGKRVGLYTSPHLVETTERIRRDGADLTQEQFLAAYLEIRDIVFEAELSHFETLTLMAVNLFFPRATIPQETQVDHAIFEVGLGGAWDATNAIPHRFCVITRLGYDHENLLGKDLAQIAANKFGIIPRLEPARAAQVTHSPLPPEVRALARQTQAETGSHWRESMPFQLHVHAGTPLTREPVFEIETHAGRAVLALPGLRGAQNTATALTAFEMLGFDPRAHLSALSQVKWPGRMQKAKIQGAPCPVYLSGDHNPQGVASLLELLRYYPRRHLHLLVGVGKDKDLDGILGPLAGLPDTSLYLTETPFRGRVLEDYGEWLGRARMSDADPARALQRIFSLASPDDLVVVTGSLYLVGLLSRG